MPLFKSAPCPFCLSADHLKHAETCPRAISDSEGHRGSRLSSPGLSPLFGPPNATFPNPYRVPGEPDVPLGVIGMPNAAVEMLTSLLSKAIKRALEEDRVSADPIDLASVVLGLACSIGAAADEHLVPPVFLIGFLPALGVSEGVALSMVRLAYERSRRYDEDMAEQERLKLEIEQAVEEDAARHASEN